MGARLVIPFGMPKYRLASSQPYRSSTSTTTLTPTTYHIIAMESTDEEAEAQPCRPEEMEIRSPITDKADEAASQEATQDHLEEAVSQTTKTIQTKGRFNFMDLPTELQLKVSLLISEHPS